MLCERREKIAYVMRVDAIVFSMLLWLIPVQEGSNLVERYLAMIAMTILETPTIPLSRSPLDMVMLPILKGFYC